MLARVGRFGLREPFNILISDEDETVRRTLMGSLEPPRWELYEADSGREALRILRSRVVHVLVSEVELPDTTAFDVAYALRRFDRQVPFILLSDRLNKELLLRALIAQAFTVIRKPVDEGLFRSTLEHLVGRWYGAEKRRVTGESDLWPGRGDELLL